MMYGNIFYYFSEICGAMHLFCIWLNVVCKCEYGGNLSSNVCGLSKTYKDAICRVVTSQREPSAENEQRWPPYLPSGEEATKKMFPYRAKWPINFNISVLVTNQGQEDSCEF